MFCEPLLRDVVLNVELLVDKFVLMDLESLLSISEEGCRDIGIGVRCKSVFESLDSCGSCTSGTSAYATLARPE